MKRESKLASQTTRKTLGEDSIEVTAVICWRYPVNRDVAKELGYGRVCHGLIRRLWMVGRLTSGTYARTIEVELRTRHPTVQGI